MSSVQRKIRFGAFIREISIKQNVVSYNKIIPKPIEDLDGSVIIPRRNKIRLRPLDFYRLLQPYISVRFNEQLRAVLPLAIYLILFQILVLRQQASVPETILVGLFAVMVGLMLFMEGLKRGLMPFGEVIGNRLPAKASLNLVLLIAMLLGIGVTFAEPAIGALKAAGSIVAVESAPYLFTMLNDWSTALVLAVGAGVGFAAVLGTLRLLYGWSLKPLIYATLIPLLLLTLYVASDPHLSLLLGLAWDCGAVTTGPVTVPLVLALGIGMAATSGKGESSLAGFGIVTLASLFPVIAVILLGLFIGSTTTADEIIAAATTLQPKASESTSLLDASPWQEIISGIRAIIPLVAFLVIVLHYILKERLKNKGTIVYGITLSVLGMIIFNLGLDHGLSRLGEQSGSLLPAAFTTLSHIPDAPFYTWGLGIFIILVFAWFLGFGATLAEPALNALGITVENLTNGAFEKRMLLYAVSIGVGCGIALGVAKIIFGFSLNWLIIPGYAMALVLTWLSTEEFVNVAWDSAGVTTGPITVPLVLAMGLGLGNAVSAIEGFGILALASIGPIVSVLGTGLWIQWKIRRHHRIKTEGALAAETEAA